MRYSVIRIIPETNLLFICQEVAKARDQAMSWGLVHLQVSLVPSPRPGLVMPLFIIAASLLLSGCSSLMSKATGGLASNLTDAMLNQAHIYLVFVDSSCRHRGQGRQLCLRLMGPPTRGKKFTLNSSLNAVAFYERLGFTATAERQEKDGVQYVPMTIGSSAA